MKVFFCALAVLFCLVWSGSAGAVDQGVYFNIGLGGAGASYGDTVDDLLEIVEDVPGVDRLKVGIDLALYFPSGASGMLGPAITAIGDRLEYNDVDLQITQVLYALSYRYYPEGERGAGFFMRGDAGFARMVMDDNGRSVTSDWGTGFLIGGGYAFAIGSDTWFSLNADYTSKSIEDETASGYSVGGAFMF